MDDPWHWDVDRVVRELCSSTRSWGASSKPLHLLLPDHLEALLREHEVDGEVLLEHDQAELCVDLGIKKLKHKRTLQGAITLLRSRSRQYRLNQEEKHKAYDSDFENDSQVRSAALEGNTNAIDNQRGHNAQCVPCPGPASGELGDEKMRKEKLRDEIAYLKHTAPYTASRVETTSLDRESDTQPSDEPTPKRRRIAPAMISTETNGQATQNVFTQAEIVPLPLEPKNATKTKDASYRYFGGKPVSRFDITEKATPDQDEDEISFIARTTVPPGRLLQRNHFMKRLLLRRGNQSFYFNKPDAIPGAGNPDDDQLLPLYGESDDEDSYDSETWKAYTQEEEEKAARAANPQRPKWLSMEEINAALDEIVNGYVADWEARKLPKLARTAHRTWNDARRRGRKRAIDTARADLDRLETRITNIRQEMEAQQYRNRDELKLSAGSLQVSIEQRANASWLLDVVAAPGEPPRASPMPRKPAINPKPQETPRIALESDEESLHSQSEDDLDAFIVVDEGLPSAPACPCSPMDIDKDGPEHLTVEKISTNASTDVITKTRDDGYSDDYEIMACDGDTVADEGPPSSSPVEVANLKETSTETLPKNRKLFSEPSAKVDSDVRTPSESQHLEIVDLTTPTHRAPSTHVPLSSQSRNRAAQRSKASTIRRVKSTLGMSLDDLDSREQRVALALDKLDGGYQSFIFTLALNRSPEHIWLDLIIPAMDRGEFPQAPYNDNQKKDALVAYNLIRMYEMYRDDADYTKSRYKKLDAAGYERIRALGTGDEEYEWLIFVKFVGRLSDRFEWNSRRFGTGKQETPANPGSSGRQHQRYTPEQGGSDMSIHSESGGDLNDESPSKKKRPKRQNQEAKNLRANDHARTKDQARRREALKAKFAKGVISPDVKEIDIINPSKDDDQGFIYIHPEIARSIKEHQRDGVIFMWDQIVSSTTKQGCLLAHTMGLGKTMQVITLLVAITDAIASPDFSVSSQIPEHLRDAKFLVLCPPALVNNWLDEMLAWAPETHRLGEFYKIDATLESNERDQEIQHWDVQGGVLIMGYNIFKGLVDGPQPRCREILLDGPSIVIADEAHEFKDPNSQVHIATANFRTKSRIALTGSPLANKVEEYFSMINWVAPNYLGDLSEFRDRYANPIKDGLVADCTSSQRSKALRMLRVLKSEVAPKVSRMTISVLKEAIPTKKEFVVQVPLTALQRKLYELYISHQQMTLKGHRFSHVEVLGLICAHPSVFLEKLKAHKNKPHATLSPQLVSQATTLLKQSSDDIWQSWKVPLLLEILDSCKKVGDHVLLFSHSIESLNYLEKILRLKKYSFQRLDGSTPVDKRQGMVKDFNKGNADIFLISTKAGGQGLNITGANRVVIFDYRYNPQHEQQAVGRAYRIGQQKPVYVYRLLCGGTFEEKMLNRQVFKIQLSSRVVDKKHPIPKAQAFSEIFGIPEEPAQQDLVSHEYRGQDGALDRVFDKCSQGIRSVVMMDTFEEETIESVELSPEDRAAADQIIRENEAKRLGLPIPSPLIQPAPFHPVGDNSSRFIATQVAASTPVAGINLDGAGSHSTGPIAVSYSHATVPGQAQAFGSAPTTDANGAGIEAVTGAYPTSPASGPANGFQHVTPVPAKNPAFEVPEFSLRPERPLMPMLGATTHIGSSARENSIQESPRLTSWPTLKGELSRAFQIHSDILDEQARRRTAEDLITILYPGPDKQAIAQKAPLVWAIMSAASSHRFVEAVCLGAITLSALAELRPTEILWKQGEWDSMPESEWNRVTNQWRQQSLQQPDWGRQNHDDPKVNTPQKDD
ncbi:hypothetical protein F5Y15DRAFT_138568 [Xylariaceae sp. FL0016]|nr:hypothetical protein F5Y15DRAFT_138568 [Xylariaceae sp. FL0016]